jgi:hypothetical protein
MGCGASSEARSRLSAPRSSGSERQQAENRPIDADHQFGGDLAAAVAASQTLRAIARPSSTSETETSMTAQTQMHHFDAAVR